jgi:hypothetical protein
VSAGKVTAQGVTVEQVKVGPRIGHIVVDRSRGVQIGDGNRQVNKFRFRVEQPRVSVDELLGTAARLRAFENLVAHPYDPIANWAFRHQMPAKGSPEGRVRSISTSASLTTRIAARVDDQGQIVVSKSQGVQVGSGVTQHNTYNERAVKPELRLEPMLRAHPYLARSLALTARHPGNLAVRRFADRIAHALEDSTMSFAGPSALLGGSIGMAVSLADGVQLGSDNRREDQIDFRLRRLAVTGWAQLKEVTGPAENSPAQPASPVDWVSLDPVSPAGKAAEMQAAGEARSPLLEPHRRVPPVDDIGAVGGFSAV